MDIGTNDPKSFWNIIDRMNKWGKSKGDLADNIAPNRWIEHFKIAIRLVLPPLRRTFQLPLNQF